MTYDELLKDRKVRSLNGRKRYFGRRWIFGGDNIGTVSVNAGEIPLDRLYYLIAPYEDYPISTVDLMGYTPRSTNKDDLIGHGVRADRYTSDMQLRSFGILPSRDILTRNIMFMKEGAPMKTPLTNNLTGYTDFYNLSCINSMYPVSLTQNELVNFPIDATKDLLAKINKELKLAKHLELQQTVMIDHTLYHNDFMCIIINSTYGLDKRISDGKEVECLSALLTGFCVVEGLTKYSDILSKICGIISKTIKDANLRSNTALKNPSDIKLSDDYIKVLVKQGNGTFNISDLTIKNKEIQSLDKDYYPYLDIEVLMDEFYQSEDKLLILHGNPGVGKSKLSSIIAHKFSKEHKYEIVMFPGRHCNDGGAWSIIEGEVESNSRDGDDTLIIIDDLDPMLFNRDLGEGTMHNDFFNSLITILDGVISKGVKFVITTNHIIQKASDSPLYRPGRLFDSILLKPLSLEESLVILKKYKVSSSKIVEFKKLNQDEYYQSQVAQFMHDSNNNIKRSYYRGENKKVTSKSHTNRIGF